MTEKLPNNSGHALSRMGAQNAVLTGNEQITAPHATPAATVWRIWTLFLLHKRQVRFVTSIFHFFDRDKMEGGRVNDVTLSRGRLRVRE
jgi:hypothetical protein